MQRQIVRGGSSLNINGRDIDNKCDNININTDTQTTHINTINKEY